MGALGRERNKFRGNTDNSGHEKTYNDTKEKFKEKTTVNIFREVKKT